MSAVHSDFLVIGSGPAGQRAAVAAAKMRKRVTLVESRSVVGGVCVNTGTIPSKTLREAVSQISGQESRSLPGSACRIKDKLSIHELNQNVQAVVRAEISVTEAQLSRNGVEILHGTAHFTGPHEVELEGPRRNTLLHADRILIAAGTRPAQSPHVPLNGRTILNSDQIFDLDELPRSLIVVGGGVIGVEYACIFALLGVRVTIVEKRPRLLEFADSEIVEALSYHLRDNRVTLRMGEELVGVEDLPQGGVVANMASKKKISGDVLLYAVGRQGAVEDLNLAAAGLEADSRGRIAVDENFRTKVERIYAAGDIIGFPSLASVAMEQGRIAALRAFGDTTTLSTPGFYPYGIYTIPEISFLGKTEEQLTAEDVPYEVGMGYYRDTARGQIRGDTTGRLKLLFHRDSHDLLGIHIIGTSASELIHIGQAVMALGGKIDYFIDAVFNYPTLAECYKVAAFNGLGRLRRYQPKS